MLLGVYRELFIKGKVKKISFETNTILVKPKKGASVTINFNEQTTLKGVDHIQQIQKKHGLKIWYMVEGDSNIAVKIEKIPDVGCWSKLIYEAGKFSFFT